jgi:subtilisin family serine protease
MTRAAAPLALLLALAWASPSARAEVLLDGPPAAGPLLRASWRLWPEAEREGWRGVTRRRWRAPLEAQIALARGGERAELGWGLWPQLEPALEGVGLPAQASARGSLGGLTGQGVVIGLVDTGIDWSHPELAGARILWLLDLGQGPREGAWPGVDVHGGALWGEVEVEEARQGRLQPPPPGDEVGHGTLLAGIVAGRGAAGEGVAPGAALIVVKANRGEGLRVEEADVLRGVRFILERAEALGLPAVVNLSLGAHFGPHDGSTAFERALSVLFAGRPGRALVVAAGNDGARDIHAAVWSAPGAAVALPVALSAGEGGAGFAVLDLWYRADPASALEVELIAPDGRRTGAAAPGQDARLLDPVTGALSISHGLPDAESGWSQAVVIIQEPDGALPLGGEYQVILRGGRGRVDAWIAEAGAGGARFTDHLESGGRLTVPATVEEATAVGAWVTRDRWVDEGGVTRGVSLEVGALAPFSGTGPSRSGAARPDLVAPGAVVGASLSGEARPPVASSIFTAQREAGLDPVLEGGERAVYQGTSLAAPFVSGAAALLLEQDPGRTSAQVAGLLRASAGRRSGEVGGRSWGAQGGFGRLSVPAAAALGRGEVGVVVDRSESVVGVTDGGLRGGDPPARVLVQARDARGRAVALEAAPVVRVEVARGEARVGEARRLDPWTWEALVELGTASGEGVVRVEAGGVALSQAPRVRFGEAQGGEVQGGACGVVWREARPWSWPGWSWWRRRWRSFERGD